MSTEWRRILSALSLANTSAAKSDLNWPVPVGLDGLDDCAVIELPGAEFDLVVGTDFVRGAGFHLFRQQLLSWADVGYYLVGANASDLAAMGATPLGVVVVTRYTSEMTDDDFAAVMKGITQACADFAMPLLGGDTGGYDCSVLSATAFGAVPRGRAMTRRGARAGDRIYVTGDVGLAAAALAYFLRAKPAGFALPPVDEQELISRWRRVTPALGQGQLLIANAWSACATDTSDGLRAACRQIAEASSLAAILEPARVPISHLTREVATALAVDPFAFAIGDSVDFRLVFTVPGKHKSAVERAFSTHNWPCHDIGHLVASATPGVYVRSGSELVPAPGLEWQQSEVLTIDRLRQRE